MRSTPVHTYGLASSQAQMSTISAPVRVCNDRSLHSYFYFVVVTYTCDGSIHGSVVHGQELRMTAGGMAISQRAASTRFSYPKLLSADGQDVGKLGRTAEHAQETIEEPPPILVAPVHTLTPWSQPTPR